MRPAKRRALFLLAAAPWALLALGAQPAAAQEAAAPAEASAATPQTSPETAITYKEFPYHGPRDYVEKGRELENQPGTGGLRTAVDINSVVKVAVDSKTLRDQLLPYTAQARADPRIQPMMDRLAALRKAVSQLQALTDAYRKEAKLYERALGRQARGRLSSEEEAAVNAATRERSAIAQGILLPLHQSLTARLSATMDEDAAAARIEVLTDPIFKLEATRENDLLPYHMGNLSSLLNSEIAHAEADFEKLLETFADVALAVELRGHLVRADGSPAVAIPLPGHNLVRPGAEHVFQKIDFTLTPEEEALHGQYQQLADQIREAQENGEDVLSAVRQAFVDQQLPIVQALEAAETAVEDAGDQLDELLGWADLDRLREWAEGPAKAALTDAVRPQFEEFEAILEAVERDVETLETLGGLASAIADSQPAQAITQLLNALSNTQLKSSVVRALTPSVWAERLERVRELVGDAASGVSGVLEPLAGIDGPIMAWNDAVSALDEVKTALDPVQEGARQALAALRGAVVAPVAADLPEPEGQKRRDVREDLDTEFNLRTLPANRAAGDEIRLGYTFFAGDEELTAGWTDTFQIQVFGWQGRAMASVALVRFKTASDTEEQWEPTAPVSYLLHRRAWPKDGESGFSGRTGPRFTFGFSTMALDFNDEDDVELGLAATIGLFNNLVILGYGVNLQADEEDFFFLAARPFSLGSLFSPARSE